MARKALEPLAPMELRKETREWLAHKTIPNVREIARDLENAGEDVRDLVKAIDELEGLVRKGAPTRSARPAKR